ncbi:MAG: ester cyclase, partial [Vicinamibacterales bacterium]
MTDYRDLVNRWFEQVWNRRRRAAILEYMDSACLTKVEGMDAPLTREAFLDYHAAFISAVPDLRSEVISVVTEESRAVVTWRARGT